MPAHRLRPHVVATVDPGIRAAAVARAAREGVPLSLLVEAALRLYLAAPDTPDPDPAPPAGEAP